ncbi:MAG TPA: thiamine-phosphate kinase [Candidatus Elarobacter sp.]|nr:thiamine-phosphate kinase [Candidatus Elarobacter sp.]
MTEDELVARIRERLRDVAAHRLLVGIGDDAAAWQPSRNNRSVITTDALVEGVHFTRETMTAEDAGWRALAANLSDIAAMGARPVLATIALGFPRETQPEWIEAFYGGIAALAKPARCAIAGGDLTRAPAIVVSITVVGEVRATNLKTRDGARPGDIVAVTGPLGASAAGLCIARDYGGGRDDRTSEPLVEATLSAFRRPEPRLREGRWLGASRHVRAMMDLSDGLSTDLARLCAASGAGATIEQVPVHEEARRVAELTGDDPREWALGGGEDFELLAAVDKRAFRHLALRFRAHFGRELLAVGRITEGEGVRLPDGTPVGATGWDHLR